MDIDIDVSPNFNKNTFPWARASVVKNGALTPHPCGMYPQSIPIDPLTKLSAIPYDIAEDFGYLKIDFLNLNVYTNFKTRAEIDNLLTKEPDWTLLKLPSNHPKLFQLANHGDLLMKIQPKNILELADVLALIRPGKKQLLSLYLKDKELTRALLWSLDSAGYSFKKSHALGYAYVIWLQLHLIEQGRI
jgi:DNA polymerase III alpha subunit